MKTEFEEKLKEICDLLRIEPKYPAEIDITRLFLNTVLKAIGEPDGYGETMQDAIEAKAKNSFRAEIKAKVFAELGIKKKEI